MADKIKSGTFFFGTLPGQMFEAFPEASAGMAVEVGVELEEPSIR